MKKIVMIAATIATILSCTYIETTYTGKPQEIAIRSIQSNLTKAETASPTLDAKIAIGVYARINKTTTAYFPLTQFTNGTKTYWSGTTPRYWPNSGKLDFFVYAPYVDTPKAVIDPAKHTLTQASVPAATDFLYVDPLTSSEKTSNSIPAPLKHAKAMLVINATTDKDYGNDLKYVITEIDFGSSIMTVGNVVVTYNDGTADFNANQVAWDTPTTPLDKWSGPEKTVPFNTTSPLEVTSKMILPQDTQVITVKYKMNNVECSQAITATGGTWVHGTKYVYTLKFTPKEIMVDATDEGWVSASQPDVNIPSK